MEKNHKKYSDFCNVLKVAKSLSKDIRLALYIDLHAHSNKDAEFIYGTWHKDYNKRAGMKLFVDYLICTQRILIIIVVSLEY